MILKGLKDNSEVIGVILFTLRIDQNIINKYNDKQVKKLMEHSIHKSIKAIGALVNLKDMTKNS